jgi:hypothetical protein
MYLEKRQSPGAIAELVLYSIPGFETVVDTGISGIGRGSLAIGGREFHVIGDKFIEVNQFGVVTTLGTVAVDTNPATLAGNGDAGNQILVTSGTNAYVYDLTAATFTQIAVLNGLATMCVSSDGYGIVLDVASSTVYFSDLNDFATWDLSNFAQRSQAPDPWITMGISSKYLHLIGTQTGEAWYNAGTPGVPFAPASGGLYNYGAAGSWSHHVAENALCWLGSTVNGSGVVLRAQGLRPETISTDATQYAFAQYTSLSEAIGDSHEVAGHTFYTLTFPRDQATWAWDSNLPSWTERGYWNPNTFTYEAWRPIHHCHAFGEDRFLDLRSGKIYRMKMDIATEVDGEGIRWQRTPPAIIGENKELYFGTFEVIAQTGIGNSTAPGYDPQMMMRKSKDGGRSFGNEVWRSMGKIGEYDVRIRWTRNGRGRKTVFEIAGDDPIRVMIAGATVDIEPSEE